MAAPFEDCQERVTSADVLGCCSRLSNEEDREEHIKASIKEALWLFDRATDFTFRGVCPSIVRPCATTGPCDSERWSPVRAAVMFGHPMAFPALCPCTAGQCGCRYPTLRLPYVPVQSVEAVHVDGAELPATSWRWVEGTNLVMRIDGEPWPTAQDLALDVTEPGTWGVEFSHGYPLPPGAKRRIASFACEIAKACNGDPCSLGERFRITRTDAGEFLFHDNFRDEGLTGDEPLDNWIMTWRGGRARTRPSLSRPRRRGGTPDRSITYRTETP